MRYEVRCAICAAKAIANLCDYIAVLEAKLEHVASVTAGVFENMADDLEPVKKPDPICKCGHWRERHVGNDGMCVQMLGHTQCDCVGFN
jgi:hypothetical protein